MRKKSLCILLLAIFGVLRLFAVENLSLQGKMQVETAVSLTPVEEAAFIKGETTLDLVLKHFAGPFRFYATLGGSDHRRPHPYPSAPLLLRNTSRPSIPLF